MKILIISPTSSGIGGIAGVVQNQLKFLKKHGYEVDVISSENTFTIPIKGLKNPSFMVSSFLKTKLKKDYDIVHAHNPASALAMKNISGKKVISLWGDFTNQITLLHGNTLGNMSGKFEQNILKFADAIIVASKDIQNHYLKLGYKSYFIPNGIDLESIKNQKERMYEKQVIFVGRLSKEKGIINLIEASKHLSPEIHLVIVGSGPEEKRVKELAEKFNNIHYLGYQPNKRTIQLIQGSDVLIQPSLIEGGMNSTLLESIACKTPVIVTSLDVYGDDIQHLKTAYCIIPNSSESILNGINEMMSNQILRKTLSENAYQIINNYSWEKIGKQFLEIYNKLINN